MKKEEFVKLVGKDILVGYMFGREKQIWNMSSFCLDKNGEPKHKRLPLIMEVFIPKAELLHERRKGEHSTHGAYISADEKET